MNKNPSLAIEKAVEKINPKDNFLIKVLCKNNYMLCAQCLDILHVLTNQ